MSNRRGVCKLAWCARPHYGRGFCSAHWQRWRSDQPLEGEIYEPRPLEERLQYYSVRMGSHLIWCGVLHSDGYGVLGVEGRTQYAHRLTWALTYGPIPAGLKVLHLCPGEPRACVEPEHLYLGTQGDNMKDRRAAGTDHNTRKTHCPQGHRYDEANTQYWRRLGGRTTRYCRTCNRGYTKASHHRRKAGALA